MSISDHAIAKMQSPSGASAGAWAERIGACWRSSFDAILEVGRLLTEAKASLDHGEFGALIQSNLPFSARTAQMLMAIAADPRITNPKHVSHLPPHWGTLYEITRLDDDHFARRIADGTIKPDMDRKDISTAVKQQVRTTREFLLGQKQLRDPEGKFGVIYEDFEWNHRTWSDKGLDRAAANHYPVAKDANSAEQIVERTKRRYAGAADDCVCFKWVTIQHLAIGIDVLRQRGFEYKSSYAWGKDKIGLGFWGREKHEILLIGVKGNIPCPAAGTQWDSLIIAPRGAHSEKPECFHEMIEAYFPNLRKLELNARRARVGWVCWGFEAPDDEAAGDLINLATGEVIETAPAASQAATSRPAPTNIEMQDIPAFLKREAAV